MAALYRLCLHANLAAMTDRDRLVFDLCMALRKVPPGILRDPGATEVFNARSASLDGARNKSMESGDRVAPARPRSCNYDA